MCPCYSNFSGHIKKVTAERDQTIRRLRDKQEVHEHMILLHRPKEDSQNEQIRCLEEELATSIKRITDLTAGWNRTISVAYDVVFDLWKVVADNFIPDFPDVDGQEINWTLLQLDMQALDLLQSAIEADETLTAIQHPPWSYKPDPAEDDPELQPYDYEEEGIHYQRDCATFLWKSLGSLLRITFVESTAKQVFCYVLLLLVCNIDH